MLLRTLALVVAVALAAPARAEHLPADRGLSLGLRLAYAVPFGSAYSNTGLRDGVDGALPLWFDLAARVARHVAVGVDLAIGPAFVANCQVDSCTGYYLHVGGAVYGYLRPRERIDPWLGFGVGYERLARSFGQPTGFGVVTYHDALDGWAFLFQGGVDVKLLPSLRVGPFAALALGSYVTFTSDLMPFADNSIREKAAHGWLLIGVRVQADL